MKTKVYIHAALDEFDARGFSFNYRDKDMSLYGAGTLMHVTDEIEIPDFKREQLVPGFIEQLRKEQKEVRAEAEVKVQRIEHQIGQLLAIENKS